MLVNGNKVKTNYKVVNEDHLDIIIPDPEPLDVVAEDMDLDIYYEDSDVLVVNKPGNGCTPCGWAWNRYFGKRFISTL